MRQPRQPREISHQAVGAYGEKIVEGELLRRGWITSNVNASIKNAVDFDLFALKQSRAVQIRVKTSGPGQNAFQFRFRLGHDIAADTFARSDFTILVRMGETRENDQFYVVPTGVVRDAIANWSREYLNTKKRDGQPRKDTGQWVLDLPGDPNRLNKGFEKKWAKYRDNWSALERKRKQLARVSAMPQSSTGTT